MINRSTFHTVVFAILLVASGLGGCGLIYKQNIQQGNALEQDDLDELYIGMNQRQVLFVLGTPSIMDPFQQQRWDYVQTFARRGGEPVQRTVTLVFEDGLLSEIIGQSDPFAAAPIAEGDPDEVASFVKQPDSNTSASDSGTSAPAPDSGSASPQDAAMESAEEEVLNQGTEIEALREPSAEERDYQRDQDVLDQNPGGGDIDG